MTFIFNHASMVQWIRHWADMLVVLGSNPTQGNQKITTFIKKFYFFSRFSKIKICPKNCSVLKPILTLPIRGQKCIVSQLFQFLLVNFDLGHPVLRRFTTMAQQILVMNLVICMYVNLVDQSSLHTEVTQLYRLIPCLVC